MLQLHSIIVFYIASALIIVFYIASAFNHHALYCKCIHHHALYCNCIHHLALYCNYIHHLALYCNCTDHRALYCNCLHHLPLYCNCIHQSVLEAKAISVKVHKLRLEVGSYALMHGTGYELVDIFLCCKFAEGDSRILRQKLARNRLKAVAKGGMGAAVTREALLLASKRKPAGRDLK